MRLRFHFRWVPFIAAAVVVSVGLSLGNWQLNRAEQKRALQQQMMARAEFEPISLNALPENHISEE